MFPSYRNQSVDLQSKSTDWFLYDGTLAVKGLGHASSTTCSSSTLIHHILTNSKEKISQSGVIDIDISDHQLTH